MGASREVEAGVRETLRDATRLLHATVSGSPEMRRLFDATYTLAEYRVHLGRLLGFFEPLEGLVANAADPTDPAFALRRSTALREDLCSMGASARDIDVLERCSRLPPIVPAGLRGYSYVVLGSMSGGKIIVQRLRQTLGPNAGFQFYCAGNGCSDARWASFCADLEKNGKDDIEAICSTAVGILEAYGTWFGAPAVPADRC